MGIVSQFTIPSVPGASYGRLSRAQAAADASPILVDDTYHLFHLTTPPFTRHHPARLRSSWWRLKSKDLVNWQRDAEPSITPGSNQDDPDADGAWAGAAVQGPDGNLNIFYTGYNVSKYGKQVILRAQSEDKHGTTLNGIPKEITLAGEGRSMFEEASFRNPYIFYNESESKYWMLVASRLANGPHWSRGCVALLTSTDLNTWTFAPEPLYSPNDVFCPESPELFTLPNGKWYLVYSRFHAPNAGTVYRVADSPHGPFRVPRDGSRGRLDGRRWYAARSCPRAGDPSKRIFFGWTGDYADDEDSWLWGGDMGIPREVSADERGHLRVAVLPEAQQHFVKTSNLVSSSAVSGRVLMSSVGSTAASFPSCGLAGSQDSLLGFNIGRCDALSFGLVFQADGNGKGHRLQFTPSPLAGEVYTVSFLTDFPPVDDSWADRYDLHLPRAVDGPELVRHDGVRIEEGVSVFFRGQLLEIFCGGRSISFRLPLPTSPAMVQGWTPRRLGFFVEDGTMELTDVSLRYGGSTAKAV